MWEEYDIILVEVSMKKVMKEFKQFISKGSVIDLAVGVIIGGAFTLIVNSFVGDIIMPVISFILGKLNFSDMKLVIVKATETASAVSINYGNFIQVSINFFLTALAIFIFIKFINKFRKKEEKKESTKEEVILLREIRDLLKKSK